MSNRFVLIRRADDGGIGQGGAGAAASGSNFQGIGMAAEAERGQRSVQSVEVGGRILLVLADHPAPMTLKDLAAKAQLPPSRAHPYLVSFGRLRLVDQDPVSGRYALGPAALQIGLACLHQSDPLKAAAPVAEELAAATGQMVIIAVWANFGPTVVKMIEPSQPLHVNMRVGTVMSILETATGRAFAAVMPLRQIEAVMAGPFGDLRQAPRPELRTAGRVLKEIAAEMKAHGVTRALGRPLPGINAFSAPVFDHEGTPVLVITALGHAERFPADWSSPFAAAVRRAAADISLRLGYRAAAVGRPAAG